MGVMVLIVRDGWLTGLLVYLDCFATLPCGSPLEIKPQKIIEFFICFSILEFLLEIYRLALLEEKIVLSRNILKAVSGTSRPLLSGIECCVLSQSLFRFPNLLLLL